MAISRRFENSNRREIAAVSNLLELSCDFAAIFAWKVTKTLPWWTPQGKFVSPFFSFHRVSSKQRRFLGDLNFQIAAKSP